MSIGIQYTISPSHIEDAIRQLCLAEYKHQQAKPNERAVEYSFLFKCLAEAQPNTVLDIGTGRTALPALMSTCGYIASGIDAQAGSGLQFNRHWYIIKDDITNIRTVKFRRFDFISCISVLEHIEEYQKAFEGMLNLLNRDGYICMTIPWNPDEFIDNIYDDDTCTVKRLEEGLCHVFSSKELDSWLIKTRLLTHEFWRIWTGKYWGYGMRRQPKRGKITNSHLACLLLQCR